MTPRTFDVEAALRDDRWIRGLARGLIQDAADADDALQEARLALMRSPPPRLADPRPWLARVAINFVRKRRREEVRRKEREHRAARPERLASSPQEAMLRVELRREVLEAVLALAEPYRSTLVLRFFEEMSLKEIAAAEEVPVNTVKTRLSRALGALRRRLAAQRGGKACWTTLLLPFLAPDLRVASGLGGASTATKSTAGLGFVSYLGVAIMSVKGIAVAVCILAVILLGGRLAVVHRSASSPAASGTGKVGAAWDPREKSGESRPGPAAALSTVAPRDQEDASPPSTEEFDQAAQLPPSLPATPEALAVREAFRLLKGRFGDGGRPGWRAVGTNIAELQEVLLGSPEGLQELLALLDAETDDDFLEAVLHHLPLARTDFRQGILDFQELHDEIWARFEEAEGPRRAAFLRFFAYDRVLSSSGMDQFLELAQREADPQVRRVAVDAIASNPDLISDTWEVLARSVERDPDTECRENAIHGLAHAEAEGARELVKAAFTSRDERLRAAALGSAAGDRIPEDVTGGDAVAYLIAEFRAARTPHYKRAILKRFVGDPRQVFEDEIHRALPEEDDMGLRKQYREALEMMEEARSARPISK